MAKPIFDKILNLFESGQDFSLTERQYLQQTGAPLPKSTYYLKKRSALSKVANDHGYYITITERTISLKRINNQNIIN